MDGPSAEIQDGRDEHRLSGYFEAEVGGLDNTGPPSSFSKFINRQLNMLIGSKFNRFEAFQKIALLTVKW